MYRVRARRWSEQSASTVYLQQEVPAWSSLFSRIFAITVLNEGGTQRKKERKTGALAVLTLLKEAVLSQMSHERNGVQLEGKKNQKRRHVSTSKLYNNEKNPVDAKVTKLDKKEPCKQICFIS